MEAATQERPNLAPAPEPEELEAVLGTSGQLSWDIGGKHPTSSSLALRGGKLDIEGEFYKGETIVLRIECRVGAVEFVDQEDRETGQAVGCARRHKARIVGVKRESVNPEG